MERSFPSRPDRPSDNEQGSGENTSTLQNSTLLPALSKPLQLVYGPLRYTWLLPDSLVFHAARLRDDFVASFPAGTDELAQDEAPSSIVELAVRFMAFLARDAESLQDHFGVSKQIMAVTLDQFDINFLQDEEVHTLAADLIGGHKKTLEVIQAYYEIRQVLDRPVHPYESNLLQAARLKDASIFTIFGGQGNTNNYFGELTETYSTYRHFIHEFVLYGSTILSELSGSPEAGSFFSKGLDVMRWLEHPDQQPEAGYLISAPVSFPVIGLLQLVQYALTCRLMGIDPGTFRKRISGLSGHSQGIIAALVVSISDSWEAFHEAVKVALTTLFWIGLRSQQAFPETTIPPLLLQESISHGEGSPSPMLSVRNLSRDVLQQQIDLANKHLPKQKQMYVGLVNSSRSFVISGPPLSLCGLNSHLRNIKVPNNVDQTRIPFSERKLSFTHVFLPISVPFHSPYLEKACSRVLEDLGQQRILSESLQVPLFSTNHGIDLANATEGPENILPILVRMMMCDPVRWEEATVFPDASHILDFGPGGGLGAGFITQQNKEGSGVRVISASSVGKTSMDIGFRQDLLDYNPQRPVKYAADWLREFGPQLVRTAAGQVYVDTKFSRLLGLDHVMVAGMTPCTVAWDFVAATMNAGYHIELAGGGYYDPQTLSNAVRQIAKTVIPGRTITLNLIYVSPHAIAWQIPAIKQLRAEGVPIDGLTIGAGIPTIEVATEYITTLGLRHISLKPGSVEAIQQVINIARAHEDFPIILQWTGGRGGGHHSFEDFHQPIVQMYAKIRECQNLIVVAGSGFGGAEDTYPYLTGSWAVDLKLSRSPMPFDGILFGSRMMTAKEAHTSTGAKQAIVDAEGSDDLQWERTYRGPHGGIMTVQSEMREPIHKIATRGVRFWADLDSSIFNLDRSKRVPELQKRREEIIERLNKDYQKVWFGINSAGEPVDVDEMTYAEVMYRMADLLYIKHQSRWIHESYRVILGDFIRRTEERFTSQKGPSMVQHYSELDNPSQFVEKVLSAYPQCQQQLLNIQDAEYFLLLCQKRGQKPVPFVPALDENFENWFKKDSLWQSEDLEAVIDQDVGRICILQGPVAARHSRVINEPVKDILDTICKAHIQKIVDDVYGSINNVPIEEYFGPKPINRSKFPRPDMFKVTSTDNEIVYCLSSESSAALPNTTSWLGMLAGDTLSWRHAFFSTDVLVQNDRIVKSPFKAIFQPTWGTAVEIAFPDEPKRTVVTIRDRSGNAENLVDVIEVKAVSDHEILLTLYEHRNILNRNVGLPLKFTYHPEAGFAPIRETMEGRNLRIKEFYYALWFGNESIPWDAGLTDTFDGGVIKVDRKAVKDFLCATGNANEAYSGVMNDDSGCAPMDFAIKASFKAMTEPLFLKAIDGDLLQTVHLNNSFRMLPATEPLKLGDTLRVTSRIDAVEIQDSGKTVQASGIITRGDIPVMEVTSRSMYRGNYSDFQNTFSRKVETPMKVYLGTAKDVTLLQLREWFQLTDPHTDLLGKTLIFKLESVIHFQDKDLYKSIKTTGQVLLETSRTKIIEVANVDYETGRSYGNPVVDYLQQHGSPLEERIMFDQAVPLTSAGQLSFVAPESNEPYARASGDYNPIHFSRVFSKYAGHAGTITHGMYTSAVVRGLVENCVAENDISLTKSFGCSFVGMVLPQDRLDVNLWHVGMVSGRKIIKVEAVKNQDEKVLIGEAEIEQPTTSFIFTGQGSQYPKMGMDLYAQSSIAREVWDRADRYLLDRFGKALRNPTLFRASIDGIGRIFYPSNSKREPERAYDSFRGSSWTGFT